MNDPCNNPFATLLSDTWHGTDGFLSSRAPNPNVDPWDVQRDSSEFRLGPSNVSHAQIDDSRRRIAQTLATPFRTRIPEKEGAATEVSMTFNPSHVRDDIVHLAAQVLAASGRITGGRDYEPHKDVYRGSTVAAAERIYFNNGQETFDNQNHPRESTSWFPCAIRKASGSVDYDYSIHPTIAELIHGAHDDQRRHPGLNADAIEHAQRPRRPMPAPW